MTSVSWSGSATSTPGPHPTSSTGSAPTRSSWVRSLYALTAGHRLIRSCQATASTESALPSTSEYVWLTTSAPDGGGPRGSASAIPGRAVGHHEADTGALVRERPAH